MKLGIRSSGKSMPVKDETTENQVNLYLPPQQILLELLQVRRGGKTSPAY